MTTQGARLKKIRQALNLSQEQFEDVKAEILAEVEEMFKKRGLN